MVCLKDFFETVKCFEKSADDNKIGKNYPACKELILVYASSSCPCPGFLLVRCNYFFHIIFFLLTVKKN